jgi:hypothetical protein
MARAHNDRWQQPAVILKHIRDGANDMNLLLRSLGLRIGGTSADHLVRHMVRRLVKAGIVTSDGSYEHGLTVTEQTKNFIGELKVSLTHLAELSGRDAIVVKPFHGIASPKELDVFVLMPFGPQTDPIYFECIRPVCNDLALEVRRADDFFSAREVMADVWAGICAAKLVVADCTGRNPNVFYEIGLAHAVGQPAILITQSADDVPFDLRSLRHIQYAAGPAGMKELEDRLRQAIAEVIKDS